MSTVYKLKGFGDGCFLDYSKPLTIDFTDSYCAYFSVGTDSFKGVGNNFIIRINKTTKDNLENKKIIENGKIQDAKIQAETTNRGKRK